MKLNLGAGNDILSEYKNHDLAKHRPEIDYSFDLNNNQWFYNNEKFDEIRAWDVIEHLNDPINFMDNCWEILNLNGTLKLKACGWQNPNYWVDPSHKHAYDILSFDYFDPDTEFVPQASAQMAGESHRR